GADGGQSLRARATRRSALRPVGRRGVRAADQGVACFFLPVPANLPDYEPWAGGDPVLRWEADYRGDDDAGRMAAIQPLPRLRVLSAWAARLYHQPDVAGERVCAAHIRDIGHQERSREQAGRD